MSRAWAVGLICALAGPAWAQDGEPGQDGERWPPPPGWGFPDEDERGPDRPGRHEEGWPREEGWGPDGEEPGPDPPPRRRRRLVDAPPPPRVDEPLRLWPEPIRCRVKLGGYVLPAVAVDSDLGCRERLRERDPDLEDGDGFAASIGVGDGDEAASWSVGVFYHLSRHQERRAGGEVDVHGAYLEVKGDVAVPFDSPLRLTLGGALGLGGMVLDHTRGFHDAGGVAALVRGHVGLRLFEHLEVEAGGGLFACGGGDEYEARGAFCSLGVTLRF